MAPTSCRSSHAVSSPKPSPSAKKGSRASTSRRSTRPRFHQSASSRAAGRVQVTVLLKSAHWKSSRDAA